MIELGVADTPLVRCVAGTETLAVDYIETSGPAIASAVELFRGYRLFLHNAIHDWSLGHPRALAQQDVIPRTLYALAVTHAPWLSIHLGFSAADVTFDGEMRPVSPTLPESELRRTMCENLHAVASAVPVPVLVENLDYNPGGAYEHICKPAFIASVVSDTGVAMLLDVAHARVSAAWLGLSVEAYLRQLPLERVTQAHVSGPRQRADRLVDDHEALAEEDYAALQGVLDVTDPLAVTLEYHQHDRQALLEQIARLRAILSGRA